MSGWIRLHRKIMDNGYWLSEPFTRAQAWIDLLLLANHSTGRIRKRGILIEVQRGQVGHSEEALAIRWKWSRGKVIRFLNELISSGTITRKPVQQNSKLSNLISILNYEFYQSDNTSSDTTDGQQTDIKRYRNKNEKKEKNELYISQFDKFYKAYPRKINKKAARKAWLSRPELSNGLFPTIISALENQKSYGNHLLETNQFCPAWPYPATWINSERWTDEVPGAQSANSVTSPKSQAMKPDEIRALREADD